MTDLTVAICTYRRGDLLRQTLDSVAAAAPPPGGWELVIVDNAGEPAVEALVRGYVGRLPARYVAEPKTGASHARNRAVEEARGPVVLFTDDDAIVDADWTRAMAAAVRDHPECDFWGGRIRPLWAGPKPGWFDEAACPMLRDAVVQYDAGPDSRPWVPGSDTPFFTCNVALRVSAVRAAGLFDTKLGHVGAVRVGNEDTRLIEAMSRNGSRGWYEPRAVVDHPVPADRATPAYALGFARRQGRLSFDLLAQDHGGRLPRWAYRAAAEQWAGGLARWAGGLLSGDRPKRFAGRMAAANATAKLARAVRGAT